METKTKPESWYFKKLGGPHDQGLIIDEKTGRNVAVAYESADAPLLAAAPDLLATLKIAEDHHELSAKEFDEKYDMAKNSPRYFAVIRAAIHEAEWGGR